MRTKSIAVVGREEIRPLKSLANWRDSDNCLRGTVSSCRCATIL